MVRISQTGTKSPACRISCLESSYALVDVGGTSRIDGAQTYLVGWAGYESIGPSEAADASTMSVAPTGLNVRGVASKTRGIAGSSIAERGWLGRLDWASAAIGIIVAGGHILGVVFHSITLGAIFRLLFKTHFRSDRPVFGHVAKTSGAVLLLMGGFGAMGFRLVVAGRFAEAILTTLHGEGFLCQVSLPPITAPSGALGSGIEPASEVSSDWRRR